MKSLEVRNLCKVYRRLPDRVLGIEDISLNFQPGQITGLLGPNGSGKSTLLRILATVLVADEGEIVYGDVPVTPAGHEAFRAFRYKLGFLPEAPFIFSKLTGMEYLRFVGDLYSIPRSKFEPWVGRLIEMFEIEEAMDTFLCAYSTGMLKKISLVVALINDPDILLLDEPTNGLDPKGIATLEALVDQSCRAGKVILLSTHILDVAQRLSDRIVIMQAGRTNWEGPVDAIPTAARDAARVPLEEFFFRKTEERE